MSYRDLKRLEGNGPKPTVGVQGLKQTVRVHIKNPGCEVSLDFNLIVGPAPDNILHRMMWEIQQELSRRGVKAG